MSASLLIPSQADEAAEAELREMLGAPQPDEPMASGSECSCCCYCGQVLRRLRAFDLILLAAERPDLLPVQDPRYDGGSLRVNPKFWALTDAYEFQGCLKFFI